MWFGLILLGPRVSLGWKIGLLHVPVAVEGLYNTGPHSPPQALGYERTELLPPG
jgi:hypothetical protein